MPADPDASYHTATRALELLRVLATAEPSLQLQTGGVIGQGGMGIVHAAEQVALGRTVAVKTLRADRRGERVAALDLLREAWVTGMLEHPNVVPIYNLGVDESGSPLIVMKRVAGVEWSRLADDAAAVAQQFGATDLLAWNLGILMQVLNALRFAHHHGVIHRDLKPSNVMIGNFGEVYLLDWGIAVSLRDDGTGRLPLAAHATQLAGTPSYMAPEMLGRDGDAPLSERTDVYLAGSVLFEIIAGRPPHVGASALEVLASVISSNPELPPGVPAELARICQTAMAEDPAQRFDSVEALRLALQQYLEHRGSAEVGARADLRMHQLLAAQDSREPDSAQHDEIYRLFGACRFGFHEALAVWRDNADARAGLARSSIAMAEYELARGNPDAALAVLADDLLGDAAPPALIERARAEAQAKARRVEELEDLGAEHDDVIGRRTRTFLVMTLGLALALAPFVLGITGPAVTSPRLLLFGVASASALLVLVAWSRETMMATRNNRRLVAGIVLAFGAQIAASLVGWISDVDVAITCAFLPLTWALYTGMLAVGTSPWFWPTSGAYLAVALVCARWPSAFMFAVSGGNLMFVISGALAWSPGTVLPSPAELAALEAAKRRRAARATQPRAAAAAPAPPSTDGSG